MPDWFDSYPTIETLTQKDVMAFLRKSRRAIVSFDQLARFPEPLTAHFGKSHRVGLHGFGTLAKRDIAYDPWWLKLVAPALKPTFSDIGKPAPAGFYLFAGTQAISFANKQTKRAPSSDAELAIEMARILFTSSSRAAVKSRDKEAVAPIIETFEDAWDSYLESQQEALRRARSPEVRRRSKLLQRTPKIRGIDSDEFEELLDVVHESGREMERLPSTYRDKSEEDLRDHFLLQLKNSFNGSATGETFNKLGKTDILLLHEGQNILIAEFKFWSGRKGHLSAIDQLFRYLAWRDKRAVLVVFVKRKGMTAIIDKAHTAMTEHPCFVSAAKPDGDKPRRYVFCTPDDGDARVDLRLALFHFPPVTASST